MNAYVAPLRATGGRLPATKALAAELGVNPTTVAKALHRLQAEGFVRPVVGSGTYVIPFQQRKRQVGIYFGGSFLDPGPESRIYPHIDRAFQQKADAAEYGLRQYINTRPSEFSPVLLNEVSARLVDAVFVVTCEPRHHEQFLRLRIPTVGRDDSFSHGGVYLDHHDFAEQAIEALVRKGCRRIALISPYSPLALRRYFNIFDGFDKGLAAVGLAQAPEWKGFPERGLSSGFVEFGEEAFRRIWTARPDAKPDGVVIQSDVCALGARRAALAAGLEIGRDIQFAVAENLESPWPELEGCIGFQFSMADVVERAMTLLDDALDDGTTSTLFSRAKRRPER